MGATTGVARGLPGRVQERDQSFGKDAELSVSMRLSPVTSATG
jgi:hypothetical protein